MINPHCLFCNKQIAPTIYKDEISGLVSKLITCPNCNIDYHWTVNSNSTHYKFKLNGIKIIREQEIIIWRYIIPINSSIHLDVFPNLNNAAVKNHARSKIILEFNDISNLICLDLNQLKEKILKLIPFL